ncbi:MAG: hypothetical protein JSU94_22155 [Phycisphaerales bacterium]|nr:MAG: hypothetical protein JSU94_22155 [Phycisphaerales bacterium]
MHTCTTCTKSACPLTLNRRTFLATAGAALVASRIGLLEYASSLVAAEPAARAKPEVLAVFVRPNVQGYWMGWPGASYDIKARQAQYTEILNTAATEHDVDIHINPEPLHNEQAVSTLLEQLKRKPPFGLIVISMSLNQSWPHINRIAKERPPIPTIVFSPMGTSFTNHLQGTRNIDRLYVAATQDLSWLNFGVRMLSTINKMNSSRLCVVRGAKTEDRKLNVIGTTLHYVPHRRYPEELQKVKETDEVRAVADYYSKHAKKIVEPTRKDILNAARNYFAAKKIMADEKCHGISVDCLPLVERRLIPAPPCIAWLRLNDEGIVGACEADWNAAISLRLTHLLFNRPGFMQDPAPNTVNNTLMGAHCSCPTRLDGCDGDPEPFILRSHSESNTGVAPQVLWRIGRDVTVMKFQGPESIILGTGKVLRNIDTPPAGGCRTSVEISLDDVPDARDTKGFHQLFIYGNLELPFKAYCRLAGIKVVHI